MISIEAERLRLRNLSQSDADIMFDYRNNETCSLYQIPKDGIISLGYTFSYKYHRQDMLSKH